VSRLFPHLAEPLQIRHKTLRHRLTFGAHTANMSDEGLPGERHLGYYRERARGGAAMIVVEPMPVHPTAVLTRGNFRHSDDAVIPGFRRITDTCHELGAVMIHQLYHAGQHGDADNSYRPNWSPSGLPSYHDSDGSHAMSEAEIEEVIEGFVQAARRARESGFDGIELFAAYHALIDQFWTPWSNRRDDRWGGGFENRMRFSSELIRRIRAVVGDEFIIGVAVSAHPEVSVALSVEALQEIVAYHDERALIDYVTCGTGSYFDFYPIIPTVLYEDKLGASYAEALKQVTKHARVQAESHIRTPENADYVIASGQADMVSIVRGQIADPHLARKALADRPQDVRGCISCNQMCWGRRSRDYWISCLINPAAGREFEWGGEAPDAASQARSLLVVGGGPAGLEAARVSAQRGHQVVLAEAGPRIGGQFRLAGMQPRRSQILELLDWYERQLPALGVEIRLNTLVEPEEIAEFGAETVVVVATGSQPAETGFQRVLPQIARLPGLEHGHAWSVEDVMSRACRPGKRVLVLDDGGNWRGCGTAWYLAEQGHQVILVSPDATVAKELVRSATDWPLRRRLKQLGAEFVTDSAVTEWHGDGATLLSLLDGSEQRVDCDALVLATPNVSERSLADALADSRLAVHTIGDCVAPRWASMAFYEGRKLGLAL
jgi:2,4-dienoyl-CoA reductase-like NADH-dependent reductase (Old Yellow Enzyme family)/thioredoxin reductase